MDDQARIPPPNYTQIPNIVLDLMSEMEETEFRVVIAIARQTFGWHKKRDKISLTQLQKLTGLSRQGVVDGIAAGERRGLIERNKDESDKRGGIWYRLLVDQSNELTSQLNGLVQTVNQSTELTRTSQLNGLELVNSVDTQKKEKERKESGGGIPAPAIALYSKLVNIRPAKFAADMIAEQVTDLARWEKTIKDWLTSGYKPANVKGMLDWYHGKGRHQGNSSNGARPPADLPLITAAADTKQVATPEERRRIIEARRTS